MTIALPTFKVLDQTGGYGIDYFLDGAYSIRIEDTLGALYRESPNVTGVEAVVDTHVPVQDEGIEVTADPTALNFIGDGVTVADIGGVATATIPGTISSLTFTTFTFTSNDTYIPTVGTKAIEIIAVGGCGGGGGVDGAGGGTAGAGSNGAGGGTVFLSTSIIDASYAIVIGASGIGGAAGNNNGTSGGDTTIISGSVNITAIGGGPGLGNTATSGDNNSPGSAGGSGSGGDYVIQGGDGGSSIINAGDNVTYSLAGSTFFGGGIQFNVQGNGPSGIGNGCGGLGARVGNVSTNFAGGNGEIGKVIIKETK